MKSGRRSLKGSSLALGTTLLVAACTDPRARPAPPTVDVSFAPSTVVHSPGDLQGVLYAYDADGLAGVRLALLSSDSTLKLDSAVHLSDLLEVNYSMHFQIPSGLSVGTELKVIGRAQNLVGLLATDTAVFLVQDTILAAPPAPVRSQRKPL